jgi:hypothetical protein
VGTIILHAGMPKAGSSSVQMWIRNSTTLVRDRLGVEPLVFTPRRGPESPGGLTRHQRGSVNSGAFLFRYLISDRDPAVLRELTEPLDEYARAYGRVLLTSEAFATLFGELDDAFLDALDALATQHLVRVAYYVRAQNEALEAAWRQWGFRSGQTPSAYVRFRERLLSYDQTRAGVARLAPHVSFGIRMFPPGPNGDGSVVDDFAQEFLGASEPVDHERTWSNAGLPLPVVNTLRHAPDGWFWKSQDDNVGLRRIKELVAQADIVEPPEVGESRRLLHAYCDERYSVANRSLSKDLGWPRTDLIPPVIDGPVPTADLSALDALWACSRTDEERMVLFRSLRAALETDDSARSIDDAERAAIECLGWFFGD